MAKATLAAWRNGSFLIDGHDLSTHVYESSLTAEREEIDITAHQGGGKETTTGIATWAIEITLAQDYDAGSVDDVLWPLFVNASQFTVVMKPDAGAVSQTNPSYTATCFLATYPPLGGKVGDRVEVKCKFTVVGAVTKSET